MHAETAAAGEQMRTQSEAEAAAAAGERQAGVPTRASAAPRRSPRRCSRPRAAEAQRVVEEARHGPSGCSGPPRGARQPAHRGRGAGPRDQGARARGGPRDHQRGARGRPRGARRGHRGLAQPARAVGLAAQQRRAAAARRAPGARRHDRPPRPGRPRRASEEPARSGAGPARRKVPATSSTFPSSCRGADRSSRTRAGQTGRSRGRPEGARSVTDPGPRLGPRRRTSVR